MKVHLVNYIEFNCRYTRINWTVCLKQNDGWQVYTGFDGQHILCLMEAEGSTRIWHWSLYKASSIHSTTHPFFYERFHITPNPKPPKWLFPYQLTYFTYHFQIPPTCTADSIIYFVAFKIRSLECKLWVSFL